VIGRIVADVEPFGALRIHLDGRTLSASLALRLAAGRPYRFRWRRLLRGE
jgi:hypothetical protein